MKRLSILFFVVFLTTSNIIFAQTGIPKAQAGTVIEVSNGIVRAQINQFTKLKMWTADGKNILDDSGFTGKAFIKIDGEIYIFGGSDGT